MLDRKTAPEFNTIDTVKIKQVENFKLQNGIDVYSLDAGTQELTRIEFIFNAGMYYQDRVLVAATTNSLLDCGTEKFSAEQLSEELDFFGSFFECSVGQNKSTITLFSLNKYLEQSLVYVEDMIKNSTFPEDELKLYIDNKKQTFLVNTKKVNVIARRKFTELLYGKHHPFGLNSEYTDYDTVTTQLLKEFYAKHYTEKNCTILISGKIPENGIDILNHHFGKPWKNQNEKISKNWISPDTHTQHKHFILKEDAIQSAIKIGRLLFNKSHEDYFTFNVLNTVLGGYFGSRLMTNIREEKGFTYGIGSGIVSLEQSGYFSISTEVGIDVTQAAISEIYKEIKKLRDEPVPVSELETVKNYMLGNFLRSTDGAFSLADRFKSIWQYGLDYSYYESYISKLKKITSDDLLESANKYLKEDELFELVVGKK